MLGMITKDSFAEFTKAISNSKLTFLSVAKNGIINSQFSLLIDAVACLSERISVNLSGNIIGDGIEKLGRVLAKQDTQLFEISLRANSIPDTSLTQFASDIVNCKGVLSSIDLSKNNISLLTGSALLRAVVDSNNGIRINLEENPHCVG